MVKLQLIELSAENALAATALALLPGQQKFVTPGTYENAQESLDHQKTWSRLIIPGARSVGLIRAYFDETHPDEYLRSCIWRITVAAPARGQGVGRFAVVAAVERAAALGFSQITAMWPDGEDGPGSFFLHLGFSQIGVSEFGDIIGSSSV